MSSSPAAPLISVIMPVYNGQTYVAEAVSSILKQSYTNTELIVIDDGSSDDTLFILNSFRDQRMVVLRNTENWGVARSLNRGIREAKGKYIARMDSDDVARSDRLERQVEFLEAHPEVGLIGGSIECLGAKSGIVHYWPDHDRIHANCLFNTPFAHPVVCWRRELFIEQELWYQEQPATAEDFELWERACRKVRCANIPSVLIDYRIDPSIKISAYLKQQYQGARQVRLRLLEAAGIELHEHLQLMLHEVGEGSFSFSEHSVDDVIALFRKLRSENTVKQYFDQVAFDAVLSKWWYSLLHRELTSINWRQLFQSIGSESPVSLSFARRIKLLVLKLRCSRYTAAEGRSKAS